MFVYSKVYYNFQFIKKYHFPIIRKYSSLRGAKKFIENNNNKLEETFSTKIFIYRSLLLILT